ncbi:MAG TPA: NADH-ubiquinone oxidoreductase-F iron-sulfur binding region domain-containing protein [Bacteroidales bacterium]|nr:NADH-ubiquinone oxidoreductase-F iron-sulfur binding region domain-containing protein [Bacteroidales bacterium]
MSEIKEFLIEEVLRNESETIPAAAEKRLAEIRRDRPSVPVIYISYGSAALIAGAARTASAIESYVTDMAIKAEVVKVGCHGPSVFEPMICVHIPGKNKLIFRNITEDKAEALLNGVFHSDMPEEDLVAQMGNTGFEAWHGIPFLNDLPYFRLQKRVVLNNCGCYDPERIDEYIARGGYRSYVKTIRNYTFEEVCDIIEKSGLRGRSGGGFLTGLKWKYALNTASDKRYLICNAKESDPGSFADRSIIEGDPHRLIEGVCIASYAISASNAIIFLKAASELSLTRLTSAIEQAREYGLIGHNIFNSGYNLEITIRIEAGAFVCGEETALIASIEGKRGMPELKPPYPTASGLFDKPTVINNVETLMNVPLIMQNGPDWFRNIGTSGSKGTKVFSIGGKGRLTGIVEVEMGTTFRTIVENIADGIKDGKGFKSLMIGGPSGKFIPEEKLDTVVDFDEIMKAGAAMGSGGIIIVDETTCMVDLVRYYMSYIHKESCGKCIPCREGTGRMLEILENIIRKPLTDDSNATLERFKGVMQLETIASVMKDTSLCGLGQTAPNPFISALENYREEFEEHIFDRRCQANVCRGLRTFSINVEKCTGCTACAAKCPANAIYGTRLQPFFIVEDKCIGCGICHEVCKFSAISVR